MPAAARQANLPDDADSENDNADDQNKNCHAFLLSFNFVQADCRCVWDARRLDGAAG